MLVVLKKLGSEKLPEHLTCCCLSVSAVWQVAQESQICVTNVAASNSKHNIYGSPYFSSLSLQLSV